MKHSKHIALVAAVIVVSALTWLAAGTWLGQPDPFTHWQGMVFPALMVVLFGAVNGLALVLLDRWPERIAALLGAWASFVVFWPGNVYYLSALPVFALFWLIAWNSMRHDLSDRRQVRISATLGRGMKFVLFAAFLMVSLGFYLTPHAQQAGLEALGRGVQADLKQELSVSADQVIRTVLRPVADIIPPILALALFVVLWSLNFIVREPAVWLGTGIFWVLRKTGFVKIETKQIESEVLSL